MKLTHIGVIAGCLLTVCSISAFTTSDQQEAPKPQNLKVLSKNISAEELDKTMKSFNVALGVKCSYCHAPKGNGARGMDFASDANPRKDAARKMMKMTQKINKKYFNHPTEEGTLKRINCNSCHNGKSSPDVTLASVK